MNELVLFCFFEMSSVSGEIPRTPLQRVVRFSRSFKFPLNFTTFLYLNHLLHQIRTTDYPAINPCRCILPIPTFRGLAGFEDALSPAVENHHDELPYQNAGAYGAEDIVQTVVVGSEGIDSTLSNG